MTARCSSPAWAPGQIALIASSTNTGVLLMTRTTGVPAGTAASIVDVGMPAAIEMIRLSGVTAPDELVEQRPDLLRLDRDEQRVGAQRRPR